MTRFLAAFLFFLLFPCSSCSLLTTDTSPIVEAEQRRGALWAKHSGAFELLVTRIPLTATFTQEVRDAILAGIQADRAAYADLDVAVLEWCAAYGSLDAEGMLKLLWEKYGKRVFSDGGKQP